jgi:hypothetical protein
MLDSSTERPSGVDGLEPADEVRSAIERYRDAVNRHDIDAVVAAFTDDGLIDCTPPPTASGTRVPLRSARYSVSSLIPQTNGPSTPKN